MSISGRMVRVYLVFFSLVLGSCSISSHLDSDPKYVKHDLQKYQRIDSIPASPVVSIQKEESKAFDQPDKPAKSAPSTRSSHAARSKEMPEAKENLKNPLISQASFEDTNYEWSNQEKEAIKEALQKEVKKIKETPKSVKLIHTNSVRLGKSNTSNLIAILVAATGMLTLGIGAGSFGSSRKYMILVGLTLFISGMAYLLGLVI